MTKMNREDVVRIREEWDGFAPVGEAREKEQAEVLALCDYALESSSTLRDTFAAAALTGLLGTHGNPEKTDDHGTTVHGQRCKMAGDAYAWADAMLAAREGRP